MTTPPRPIEDLCREGLELLEKATGAPWFVHDFSEIEGGVTISCDHPASIMVAEMANAMTSELSEKQANAAALTFLRNNFPTIARAVIERGLAIPGTDTVCDVCHIDGNCSMTPAEVFSGEKECGEKHCPLRQQESARS